MVPFPKIRELLQERLYPNYNPTIAILCDTKSLPLTAGTAPPDTDSNPIDIIINYLLPDGIKDVLKKTVKAILPPCEGALRTILEYASPRYPTPIEIAIQEITSLEPQFVELIFNYLFVSITIYGNQLNNLPPFCLGTPGQLQKDLKAERGVKIIDYNNLARTVQERINQAYSQAPEYVSYQLVHGALSKLFGATHKNQKFIRQFIPMRDATDEFWMQGNIKIFYNNGEWYLQAHYHLREILFSYQEEYLIPPYDFFEPCMNPYGRPHATRFTLTFKLCDLDGLGFFLDAAEIYSTDNIPDNNSILSAQTNTKMYAAIFTQNINMCCLGIINLFFDTSRLTSLLYASKRDIANALIIIDTLTKFPTQQQILNNKLQETQNKLAVLETKLQARNSKIAPTKSAPIIPTTILENRIAQLKSEKDAYLALIDAHFIIASPKILLKQPSASTPTLSSSCSQVSFSSASTTISRSFTLFSPPTHRRSSSDTDSLGNRNPKYHQATKNQMDSKQSAQSGSTSKSQRLRTNSIPDATKTMQIKNTQFA